MKMVGNLQEISVNNKYTRDIKNQQLSKNYKNG